MLDAILNVFSEEITNALGWTLIHSLWQASLIALIMSSIHKLSVNKSSAYKYNISVLSMVAVLICSVVTFFIYYSGTSSVSNVTEGALSLQITPEATVNASGILIAIQTFFVDNLDHINVIWIVGVILFMLRFILSYAYIKYLQMTSIKLGDSHMETILTRMKSELDITRNIFIGESSRINVPIVVGYLKPYILFPIGILNMLTAAEVEAILMHELAHVKRQDYIINIMLTAIEILFYFHPAVWWISANVKAERENCCDDYALSSSIDSVTYAKVLVKLQELKLNGTPALAMPFSSHKYQLLNRIKRIMNMPQTKNDIKEKSIATVLLMSIVLLFSQNANSKPKIEQNLPSVEPIVQEDKKETRDKEELIKEVISNESKLLRKDNEVEVIDEEVELFTDVKVAEDLNYKVRVLGNPSIDLLDNNAFLYGDNLVIDLADDLTDRNLFIVDTLPTRIELKNNSSFVIKTERDGKEIEMEKKNGEITKLKIDGKTIPESEYENHRSILDDVEGDFIFDFDQDFEFERAFPKNFEFNDSLFSNSFGMLFDGNNWREFGGNLDLLLEGELFEKMKNIEEHRYNYRYDNLHELEELKDLKGIIELKHLKGLEHLEEIKELEQLKELEHFEHLEEIEELAPLFERLGEQMGENFNTFRFDIDNDVFEKLHEGEFDILRDNDFIFERKDFGNSGTVVDKMGRALNKDGLLDEYKANKIELSGKHLKINGDKMPKALFEKYKRIYQEATGAALTKKSKMVFDVEGMPSNRKVRTF